MQPTIPLELQLQIFELAIPPLMRRNLPHLRELMKTWPLVSRAWKAWAYAKVPVVPKLVLENAKTDQATFDRFLAAVADSGRVVKRFEVDLAGWDEQSISIDRLRDFLGHAETLWLAPPEDEYEWVFDLAACAGTDTEFIEVVYNRDDPLEADFDVEEWALSVGA
ncbi:hypothetical protein JCM10450v2_007773 [Rhodotorula kratochvilovae]